jgi:hypothetical protein
MSEIVGWLGVGGAPASQLDRVRVRVVRIRELNGDMATCKRIG